ncbi:MAG: glycosyltransferase family 4 protein [Nitrososphaeria archaeon]
MQIVQVYGGRVLGIIGGHEYVVRRLSEELLKCGFRVSLLCPTQGHKLTRQEINNIVYYEVPSHFLSNRIRLPRFTSLLSIINILRNADLIHVHCPDNPFSFIVALLTKFLNKHLVVTVLAYGDDFKHHEKIKRIFGFFTIFQHTIAIWLSNKVHVESLYDLDKLHAYKDKIIMIPPGIEDLVLKAKPSRNTLERMIEKIKLRKGERIILFLGRLHKAKGVFHALSALSLLKKSQDIKMVMAGPSNQIILDDIKKHINKLRLESNVIYLGEISEEEKIALLDIVDVLVVPSLSDIVEAYSIVSSEAWARKKMVVAYSVGALKYRVKPGINGYLAQPLDVRDLANNLKKALSSNKCINMPSDVWSWEKVRDHFCQTYLSLLRDLS